jgi:hypothetical protein
MKRERRQASPAKWERITRAPTQWYAGCSSRDQSPKGAT